MQRFVETVAFYHPAVWWLSRNLSDVREESCDDIVLSCGCDRADYAESLISMNQWAQSAMINHHGPLALEVAGRKPLLKKRLLRILGVNSAPVERSCISSTGGLVGTLVFLLICGIVSLPFLVKAQEDVSVEAGEVAIRIPKLHPVEREAIEKIERLVEKSQALAKTEDELTKEYAGPTPSEKLMNDALELLEIYCGEGAHPDLLRLHRKVNLLAGRPEHAEEFQKWMIPSGHYRLAREYLEEEQWQAAETEYLKAFETGPEINEGWDAGYLRVLGELRKFDEAVEFIRSREVESTRRRKSSFPWGSIADYPAIPVPLCDFSAGSWFAGSRIFSGEVNLSFTIDAEGRASLNQAVNAIDGIPFFSEKIEKRVSSWRFAPRREAGIPVATKLEMPFRYESTLPSVGFKIDDDLKIEDVKEKVTKNVVTYGLCEVHILVRSEVSYVKAIQVFRTCVENGATVVGIREENRPDAQVPAPQLPPEIDINGVSQLRLNSKPATIKEVTEAIRMYQAENPDPVRLSIHTASDNDFAEKVKTACEQASSLPLVVNRFSKYVVTVEFTDLTSADGKTMFVSRPNRDGQPLLSVSRLKGDGGDPVDQPFSLPVLSDGAISLDGQSVSFDEISDWRSLAGNLTGTKPGAVQLLLKPDASFGYALDAFEACQREGGVDVSVSILGAP